MIITLIKVLLQFKILGRANILRYVVKLFRVKANTLLHRAAKWLPLRDICVTTYNGIMVIIS